MKNASSRLTAAEILSRWMDDRRFPDREMERVRQGRAFVMEVVYGVVRQRNVLQWIEQGLIRKMPDPFVRALIHSGWYQLLFMDGEDYAAISETVNLAKRRSPGTAKMVNAVLRRVQRERERIFLELKRQPDEIRLSHPAFLLRRWTAQYGEAETRKLAEWNNRPAETFLRREPTRVEEAELLARFAKEGIELEPHPFASRDRFFALPRGLAVHRLPGYDEGWFSIQDPATSVAVDLLRPRPEEAILDACAAPGGKTMAIASRMAGTGSLTAMDLHADRLAALEENLNRLGLDQVERLQGDARDPKAALENRTFDAVLLDVPCLNTGVLRRRIDARWRVNPRRLAAIAETQREMLDACSRLVRPGGRLVYSTCSLEAEENEDLVAAWVRKRPEFRREKARKAFPPKDRTDGAFAALLRRID